MAISDTLTPKEIEFLRFQKKKGVDAQTAFSKLLQLREAQNGGQAFGSKASSQQPQKPRSEMSYGEKFGQSFKEFVSPTIGFAKEIGKRLAGASELGQKGLRAITNPLTKALGADQAEIQRPEGLKDALTAKNTGEKIGMGLEQIGEFIAPSGVVLRGARALSGAKALMATKGQGAIKGIGKAFVRKAALPVAEGLTAGAIGAAQDEGGENFGQNFALGAAVPIVGSIGKTVKKFAGKALPEALAKSALRLTPTQKAAVADISLGGESAEQYLLRNKIGGEPAEIARKLAIKSKNARTEKLKVLGSINEKYQNTAAEKVTDILKDVLKQPGLEKDLTKLKILTNAIKGNGATLKQLDELKTLGDIYSNPYKISGSIKEGAADKGFANLRKDLRVFIEKEAKKQGVENIQELNNTIRLTRKISDVIKKQDIVSGGNSMASLSDLIVGGGTIGTGALIGAAASGGDIKSALKGMLLGTMAFSFKKAMTPKVRIQLASALSKAFDSGEAGKILKFMNGDTTVKLSSNEKEKMIKVLVDIDAIKLLPEGKKNLPKSQINTAIPLRGKIDDEPMARIANTAKTEPSKGLAKGLEDLIDPKEINFIYDKPKKDALMKAESEIIEEMFNSTKGERIFNDASIGGGRDVTGIKSTFPKWVSPDLRSKKLFNKIIEDLMSGSQPKTEAGKRLYKEMIDEAKKRLKKFGGEMSGALKDHSFKEPMPEFLQ